MRLDVRSEAGIVARVSTLLWICAAGAVIGLVTANWGLLGASLLGIPTLLAYGFIVASVRQRFSKPQRGPVGPTANTASPASSIGPPSSRRSARPSLAYRLGRRRAK